MVSAHEFVYEGLELLHDIEGGRVPHALQKQATLLVILHQLKRRMVDNNSLSLASSLLQPPCS